jgi:glycosyltransferase involved in cell wall biosynthesis
MFPIHALLITILFGMGLGFLIQWYRTTQDTRAHIIFWSAFIGSILLFFSIIAIHCPGGHRHHTSPPGPEKHVTCFPEKTASALDISIVIPLYNEEANIEPLVAEIETAMAPLRYSWQLILVDDGSSDGTRDGCLKLTAQKKYIRYLRFRQNSGQSAALDAGFRAASGRWVVTLDGDGQNNPADIPRLMAFAEEGYDLVAGRRRIRCDSAFKKIVSRSANFVRRYVLGDHVSDSGCAFKVMRRDALGHIKLYRGMHRFLPALFQIEGFRIQEVEVDHRPRHSGVSKYSFSSRGISTAWDLLSVLWMQRRHLSYEIEQEAP